MTSKTTKRIGSAKARSQVKQITKRALDSVKHLTPTEAAPILGVSVDDMRNMRQGNKMSVAILLKMVRVGRYSPKSIIEGPKLRRMPKGKSTRGAQQKMLDGRVRKLSWLYSGKYLAKMTGLSVTGAYGLRYAKDAHVTLYTVLGITHGTKHSINELIFGG